MIQLVHTYQFPPHHSLQLVMLSKYRNLIIAVLVFICVLVLSYLGCFDWGGTVSPEVFTQQAVERVRQQAEEHCCRVGFGPRGQLY